MCQCEHLVSPIHLVLQITRLAKYVNDLRKKTSDQDIAKRGRKLIKAWQSLVSNTPSSNSSLPQGYSPALSVGAGSYSSSTTPTLSRNASPALQRQHRNSPGLGGQSTGRIVSPAVHQSNWGRSVSPAVSQLVQKGRSISPALNHRARLTSPPTSIQHHRVSSPASSLSAQARLVSPAHRVVSPLVQNSKNGLSAAPSVNRRISPPNSRLGGSSRFSPSVSNNVTGSTATSPNTPSSRSSTPLGRPYESSSSPYSANNHIGNNTDSTNITSKTYAANKKRRRSDESVASDVSAKRSRTTNGDSTPVSLTERTKTPKVKTTVQLIAELQAQKRSSLTASDTITKIVTNQIEREPDDINASIVPAGAKPRPRKKPGAAINPPDVINDMRKTKSDLVHRFLQQTASISNDSSLDGVNGEDDEVDILGLDATDIPKVPEKPVIDLSIDPYSLLPPLDYASITWSDSDEEPDVMRRNPITGEWPEGYTPTTGTQVTACSQHVSRVLGNKWNGVNGTQVKSSGDFHEWTDTFTIDGDGESAGDVCILPYVDI